MAIHCSPPTTYAKWITFPVPYWGMKKPRIPVQSWAEVKERRRISCYEQPSVTFITGHPVWGNLWQGQGEPFVHEPKLSWTEPKESHSCGQNALPFPVHNPEQQVFTDS